MITENSGWRWRLGWRWVVGLAVVVAGAAASRGLAGTNIVSNTLDSGSGSLRQALANANPTNGLNTIMFQIPGAGTHTIALLSALPTVSGAVVIDGTTQPGFVNQPVIELNGASAGSSIGLRLLQSSSNCVVRGLAINRFGVCGIRIEGNSNWIHGNYIGTDPAGAVTRPNGGQGILVYSSRGNVIGGTNAADRNVISGNSDAGVYLYSGGGNVVLGNFIGTTAAGTGRLGNANNGITVYGSSSNIIGSGTSGGRNVVAGNTGSGVYLTGSSAKGNVVQGNYFGTDASGGVALGNTGDGITLSGAVSNILGGASAGAGNVIAGNGQAGVSVTGSGGTNNVVLGNYIGADVTGRQVLGNALAGIILQGAGGNTIGGTGAGAGNLIAGNKQDGLFITNSAGNVLQGNFIGVDATGIGGLGNGYSGLTYNGITIFGASSNVVGGSVAGARNVVSGNAGSGIYLVAGSTGTVVEGNYIGVGADGQTVVGNGLFGLRIESGGNVVGGIGAGARNLISGNSEAGIMLLGAMATNNVVAGNFIGTDASGTGQLGNGSEGLYVSGAPGNTIGGTGAGAGNLISGNGDDGIYLTGASTTGTVIQGNTIGADVTGTAALGNYNEGVYLENASANTIGGLVPGAGNLISANGVRGIWLTNASWNVIQANWIGTQRDGVSGLGNGAHGVECEVGANNNLIGGAGAAGNRIAYSQMIYAGVRIRDNGTNNAVLGNAIFANGGLGIDLGSYGVNPNVPCDFGTWGKANEAQNYPVLTQVATGSGTGVRGTLNSRPNTMFRLQFFANPPPGLAGYGETQLYLGDETVLTGADCNAGFVVLFANPVPAGYAITATATDGANNTSEFCARVPAVEMPVPMMTSLLAYDGQRLSKSNLMVLSWTNSATFVLQEASNLTPPIHWMTSTNAALLTGSNWPATNVPVPTGNNWWVVMLTNPPSNKFYRLSFE